VNVRTIIAGSNAYIWANIVEQTGADLAQTTFKTAIVPKGSKPTSWGDPASIVRKTKSNVRVAAMVDSAVTPGGYQLYVRVSDFPEDEVLYAGYFLVR